MTGKRSGYQRLRQLGVKGWLGCGLVLLGIVGIFVLLFYSVGDVKVRDDFIRDFLFSAVGALTTLGVTLISAGEKVQRDRNIRTNEIIAQITPGRDGKNGNQKSPEADFDCPRVMKHVEEYSHDQVRRSPARELFTVTRTKLVAAQARWKDTFEKLAQSRDFHSAWDLYFVLSEDIRESINSVEELGNEIDRLEGDSDEVEDYRNKEKNSGAGRRETEKLHKALRPLRAAIARRDESYVLIPSLETFLGPGRSNGNHSGKSSTDWMASYRTLASFWALFDIVSTDMRNAYRHLHEAIINQDSGVHPSHNVEFCRNTLGACLERVRNSLAILGNGESTVERPGGKDLSDEDEGNTIITTLDLKRLVDNAKRIERGSDTSEVVPATFGVMVRDLYTAYKQLQDA